MESLPPASSLVRALANLGHEVTLFCNHRYGGSIRNIGQARTIDLGEYPAVGSPAHFTMRLSSLIKLRRELKEQISAADIVWTTSDNSAVYCLDIIPPEKHVLQLAELVEYVPLIGSASLFKSKRFVEQARLAKRVVVPEINRAFIQKAWWNLPKTPTVLPNKPYLSSSLESVKDNNLPYIDKLKSITANGKRILLYQGGFTPDRDLETYCKAAAAFDGKITFCLMGPSNEYLDSLCTRYDDTLYLGMFNPPMHLFASDYALAGVLPYRSNSGRIAHLSALNSLYCAPNKLWEYSLSGLPMVANNLPGLKSIIETNRIGVVVEEGNVASAIRAIETILEKEEMFRSNSSEFYRSFDYISAVETVLQSD